MIEQIGEVPQTPHGLVDGARPGVEHRVRTGRPDWTKLAATAPSTPWTSEEPVSTTMTAYCFLKTDVRNPTVSRSRDLRFIPAIVERPFRGAHPAMTDVGAP